MAVPRELARHFRSGSMLLKKSVVIDEQQIHWRIRRTITRGTTSIHAKAILDPPNRFTRACAGEGDSKTPFARFSQWLNFRLFHQYVSGPNRSANRHRAVATQRELSASAWAAILSAVDAAILGTSALEPSDGNDAKKALSRWRDGAILGFCLVVSALRCVSKRRQQIRS